MWVILVIIGIIVLGAIMESNGGVSRTERDRIQATFDRNRAAAQVRKDQDCANGIHICDGSGYCTNCGTILPEHQKHFCNCAWRGEVPYYGHRICDNCSNLRVLKK